MSGAWEVLLIFLRLGCTSFGGPVAHLGYFQREFVEHRRWLTQQRMAELIALAQPLPGPASSQTGFGIGVLRAGWLGGLAAWIGFTLPSAVLMLLAAMYYGRFDTRPGAVTLHALQLVAVAIVAQAVVTMRQSLAPDWQRLAIAGAAAAMALIAPPRFATIVPIAFGAVTGILLWRRLAKETGLQVEPMRLSRRGGVVAGALFFGLFAFSLLTARLRLGHEGQLAALFYRCGALVFGGGHVVLPLLEDSIVAGGWATQPVFLAGYGAAQALPGPLFTFAAYLGAVARPNSHPLLGGVVALVALFAPGLLAMAAVLPFAGYLHAKPGWRAALRGVNAAVVGVLAAALYRPLLLSTVHNRWDALIVAAAYAMLAVWRVPSWLVVVATCLFCLGIAAASGG